MTRTVSVFIVTLALVSPVAKAQLPYGGFPGPNGLGGFGGYGPFAGGYGFGSPHGGFASPFGGFGGGYGPFAGGYGFGSPYGGYGGRYGGNRSYGPFNFSQQLFQQQSSLTQQIFQQQQQALIGQIQEAQARLARFDGIKREMFVRYLGMNDTDKAEVRTGLMNDYLGLDAHGREAWRRDAVVQIIIGKDLDRLDGMARFRDMSEADKTLFRQTMLDKYRSLPAPEQQAWQNDQIVGSVLGRNWWLK